MRQYNDELHLVDAITTLKRTVYHRVKVLSDAYNINSIPIVGKPRRTIDLLAFLGIIRPAMLVQLIDIRNAIEHEDVTPPSHIRCVELLDFVWYFLRSTDRMACSRVDEIEFEASHDNNSNWLIITINPEDSWNINIRGWLSKSMIFENELNNSFEVQISSWETRDAFINRNLTRMEESTDFLQRKRDDLYIIGKLIGPVNETQNIYKLYFDLSTSSIP